MKRFIYQFVLLISMIVLISCGNKENKDTTVEETTITTKKEVAHTHYQCPMKCEEDKVYEEEGACPVCKMDLVAIEEHDH